jgi:hypothetical protein
MRFQENVHSVVVIGHGTGLFVTSDDVEHSCILCSDIVTSDTKLKRWANLAAKFKYAYDNRATLNSWSS